MGNRTNNWARKAWRSVLGRGDREAQGIREDTEVRQPCTQTLMFEWLQRVVTFKLTTEGVWFSPEEVAVTVKPSSWESWEAGPEASRSRRLRGCSSASRECLPPVDPAPCPHAPAHTFHLCPLSLSGLSCPGCCLHPFVVKSASSHASGVSENPLEFKACIFHCCCFKTCLFPCRLKCQVDGV